MKYSTQRFSMTGIYASVLIISAAVVFFAGIQTVAAQATATLTLHKVVVNNNGGAATTTDWTLQATGNSSISGVDGSASTTNATVSPGAYDLGEIGPSGYTPSAWVCTGTGNQTDGDTIVLGANQNATCTITNDDIPTLRVHLLKYLDGAEATSASANNYLFPMRGTWQAANINSGATTTSDFLLGVFAGGAPDQYGALSDPFQVPAYFSAFEIPNTIDGSSQVLPADSQCEAGKYLLLGYSTSSISFADAAAQAISTSTPAFSNLSSDRYIIVWNQDCTPKLTVNKVVINDDGGTATTTDFTLFIDNATTTSGATATTTVGAHVVSEGAHAGYAETIGGDCDSNGNVTLAAGDSKTCTITNDDIAPQSTTTLKVHILKYLDGSMATASSSNNYQFPMTSTWQTANLNGGATTTGNYVLGNFHGGAADQYGADTSAMEAPAYYTTSEITDNTSLVLPIGAQCEAGKFRLTGYSTSSTSFADAASQPSSTSTPDFVGLDSDRYIIVHNITCAATTTAPTLTVNKVVINDNGGTATTTDFVLFIDNATTTSGVASTTSVGAHIVSEGAHSGYTSTISGDCDSNGNVTLAAGENKTCTITNNDIPTTPPVNVCSLSQAPSGYTLQNGTPGHDNVTLAPNTMFVGMGGNDRVTAGDGDFIICTGDGNDRIRTGNGNVIIDAGDGNNSILTGDGTGDITTGSKNDKITTGNGAHTINAGDGNNNILTGDGDQTVTTGTGNDKITTGNGNDTVSAGNGNNNIKTNGGTDTITAGTGNDKVDGGSGTDSCNADGGFNSVINCP